MFCSNCGHELAPEAKFCSNCGAPVTSGAPAGVPFETPAERRERERREDFAKAWGSTTDRDPSASPQDDESSGSRRAEHETESSAEASRSDDLVDRDPSAAPQGDESASSQDDGDSTGTFATRPGTWEVERAKLRSGEFDDDEWSMSNLGPAKPPRRRTWLWVLLGIIAVIVIACCIFAGWMIFTDSGQEWIENLATQTAADIQRATEAAATPQP